MEQPDSVLKALKNFGRLSASDGRPKLSGFDNNKELALNINNLLLIGSGSSFNAALYGAYMFKNFSLFGSVVAIEASNILECDMPKEPFGSICITQSGESADVLRAMILARKSGSLNIGVVNVVGSLITTLCNFGSYLHCGRETSVAATKSFTASIIVLQLIAMWYAYHKDQDRTLEQRKTISSAFSKLSSFVSVALNSNRDAAKSLAQSLSSVKTMFILGKGTCYPIAREMSIKIKEVCYIHAEAMPLGEFKHGPLSLIETDFDNVVKFQSVVIVIAINNELINEVKVSIEQLKSRKAFVIVVSDCLQLLDRTQMDFLFEVPHCKVFAPLLCLYPIQLLAYEIAKLKNLDPDKPRNLAKTVTVI